MTMEDPIRACHISSVGMNVKYFFRGQFAYLAQRGFGYTVITSEPTRDWLELPDSTEYISIPITRSISPLTDLCSCWKMFRLFRQRKYDFVQYTTPKGALLGSIAAFLARVPVRLYLLWGIYYVGQKGLRRHFFKFLERLSCRLSTHVNFDGFQLRQFAIDEGLARYDNSSVIGEGSDNGIDIAMFDPERWREAGQETRKQWNIPADALVIGSIMRLAGDKGINELATAFDRVSHGNDKVYLLIAGPQEERDRPRAEAERILRTHPRVRLVGSQDNVLPYYAAMDIFCLPTYREGFSAVDLEAQAMAVPVVTTKAIGASEVIVDGLTGVAVPVKDIRALTMALTRLLNDAGLRHRMGQAGRARILEKFEQSVFWAAVVRQRLSLLNRASDLDDGTGGNNHHDVT